MRVSGEGRTRSTAPLNPYNIQKSYLDLKRKNEQQVRVHAAKSAYRIQNNKARLPQNQFLTSINNQMQRRQQEEVTQFSKSSSLKNYTRLLQEDMPTSQFQTSSLFFNQGRQSSLNLKFQEQFTRKINEQLSLQQNSQQTIEATPPRLLQYQILQDESVDLPSHKINKASSYNYIQDSPQRFKQYLQEENQSLQNKIAEQKTLINTQQQELQKGVQELQNSRLQMQTCQIKMEQQKEQLTKQGLEIVTLQQELLDHSQDNTRQLYVQAIHQQELLSTELDKQNQLLQDSRTTLATQQEQNAINIRLLKEQQEQHKQEVQALRNRANQERRDRKELQQEKDEENREQQWIQQEQQIQRIRDRQDINEQLQERMGELLELDRHRQEQMQRVCVQFMRDRAVRHTTQMTQTDDGLSHTEEQPKQGVAIDGIVKWRWTMGVLMKGVAMVLLSMSMFMLLQDGL